MTPLDDPPSSPVGGTFAKIDESIAIAFLHNNNPEEVPIDSSNGEYLNGRRESSASASTGAIGKNFTIPCWPMHMYFELTPPCGAIAGHESPFVEETLWSNGNDPRDSKTTFPLPDSSSLKYT